MQLQGYTPPARNADETARPETSFAYRSIDVRNPADQKYLETVTAISRYSSRDSWKWYDQIGEVHYGISRSAKIAGYTRLIPQHVSRKGEVDDATAPSTVDDVIASIYGAVGGMRGLTERFYTLMKIPAEGFLIRTRTGLDGTGDPDGYWVMSPDEIDRSSFTSNGKVDTSKPVKWITAATTSAGGQDVTQFTREVQPEDFLGRVWNPSKRFIDMVDSPMTALNPQCEMLDKLTKGIMGRLQQRFAIAGILLLPSSMSDAEIAGQKPTDDVSMNKVMRYLITLMTRNVMSPEEAIAHIPALLMGPAADLDKVRHIILDTMIAETDIHLRAELIDRILVGLDVQKAQVKGEGQNHWGAWADAEQERRIAVQPDMEAFAHMCTRAILWPALKKLNWQPEKILRWRLAIDLTDAAVKTNQAEDFRLGFDRGWVGEEAGRRVIGADATDVMTPEERVRHIGLKLADPYLATYGLEEQYKIVIDLDKVQSSKAPGPNPGPADSSGRVGPGVGQPGSPAGRDSNTPKSKEPG